MELIRGQAAKVQGSLQSMLSLLKGLPLGYNRDLQIDKEVLLPALDTTNQCLIVAATAVANANFDVEHCAAEANRGYLNATDLADLLVAQNVPFRDAHGIAGQAVNRAVELGVELHELPKQDQDKLLPQLDGDLAELLSVESVLNRRNVIGGTAPNRVRAEVERWRIQIAEWAEGYHEFDDLDPDYDDLAMEPDAVEQNDE
jgi:argininosuccinate lyase